MVCWDFNRGKFGSNLSYLNFKLSIIILSNIIWIKSIFKKCFLQYNLHQKFIISIWLSPNMTHFIKLHQNFLLLFNINIQKINFSTSKNYTWVWDNFKLNPCQTIFLSFWYFFFKKKAKYLSLVFIILKIQKITHASNVSILLEITVCSFCLLYL